MNDKKTIVESIEDKIKKAAEDVEDFADKVTADEEPNVVETNADAAASTITGRPTQGS